MTEDDGSPRLTGRQAGYVLFLVNGALGEMRQSRDPIDQDDYPGLQQFADRLRGLLDGEVTPDTVLVLRPVENLKTSSVAGETNCIA